MGDRKWEDLPVDCLVDIFSRVGWVSLVDGVPYVCKSWYQVTLSPLCWQSLIFPEIFPGPLPLVSSFHYFHGISDYDDDDDWLTSLRENSEAFIKFVIRRSRGSVNVISLPDNLSMTSEALRCIGEGCPSLKRLVLADNAIFYHICLSSMICKWRNLEALDITGSLFKLNEIISHISLHCNNFVSLSATDVYVHEREATAIATLLPNIKFLTLRESRIERSIVVIILQGCKELVYVEVGVDFDVDDEILNLAAHIPTVKLEVEHLESDDYDYDYYDNYASCFDSYSD